MIKYSKQPDVLVIVTCDCNDADYLTCVTKYTKEEWLKIKPMLEALSELPRHFGIFEFGQNYAPTWIWEHYPEACKKYFKLPEDVDSETVEDYVLDFLMYVTEMGEYGWHTIKSIEIIEKD